MPKVRFMLDQARAGEPDRYQVVHADVGGGHGPFSVAEAPFPGDDGVRRVVVEIEAPTAEDIYWYVATCIGVRGDDPVFDDIARQLSE